MEEIPPLYQDKIPISQAKKKDLQALCNKQIIPPEYHSYYSNLPSANIAEKCPAPAQDEEVVDTDME